MKSVARGAPRPPRAVRLIWYDPDSDQENPTVSYDSAAEDPFFMNERK
jgi:hypothetical protein